ncbi:MAG: acyltransferase family protein [Promethearchaeota archaeon]
MKRLKAIDIFRGLCMAWMVLNHLINWWIKSEFSWVHDITIMILDPIGASGFLFISGVSIAISYRNRLIKVKTSEDYTYRMVKNSYILRAFFIFIIAILYNIPLTITLLNPSYIWTWFILLTVSISLFIAWPLLHTPKIFRLLLGILIIFSNQILLIFLIPFKGEMNIFGVLYHILYHDIVQDPILVFFPFFLFGTIVGDLLFDSYMGNNHSNRKKALKKNLLIPAIITGAFLIISGILFKFPDFLIRESLSWIFYSIGIEVFLFSTLLLFEEFVLIDIKKSYKLLFYYSYYSLTVYLSHNLLYFLFLGQLNIYNIWIFVLCTFFLLGLVFRIIYKKWEGRASVKVQIGRISLSIARKIEEKHLMRIKNKSYNETEN